MIKAEFGIKVPSFPTDEENGRLFTRKILRFIRETEPYFKTIWVSDHLTPWIEGLPKSLDTLECWTTTSYLAGLFPHRNFGTAVLCNSFRNPALVAKMAATLDKLTGKRFVLGMGAGWREQEYIEYGYDFPPPAVRIRQLSEGIQIIRKLWTEDNVTFNGRYFKVNDLTCYPHPKPCPPIMVGGAGENLTLRVVAKYADWWNTSAASLEDYKRRLFILSSHCDEVKRNFARIRKTVEAFVALGRTRGKAVSKVLTRRQAHFVGTPEEATNWVGSFIDLGVDYFVVRFLDEPSPAGAKLFGDEVIPDL